MSKMTTRRLTWLLGGTAFLIGGCEAQDADHLARATRLLVHKAEDLTGGAGNRWAARLQAIGADPDAPTLETKVASRLRWDKALEGAQIQVAIKEDAVELTGTIRDHDQRQRAIDLAEATAGVEKVTEKLALEAEQKAKGEKGEDRK
jgi:hypothetical protein